MLELHFSRGWARVYRVTIGEEDSTRGLSRSGLRDRFLSRANRVLLQIQSKRKLFVGIMVLFGSVASLLIGSIFFGRSLLEGGDFHKREGNFEQLPGFDIPCFTTTKLCSLSTEYYRSGCLERCNLDYNCHTAAYNSRDAVCKLYIGRTPYMMNLDPYPDHRGTIFVKKSILLHRLRRQSDNLFYFVSETPLVQDRAQSYCYDSYEYAHVALLQFHRQQEGIEVATDLARDLSAKTNENVELLLHIVAGAEEGPHDTLATIAQRVDHNLQFENSKPRRAKMMPIVITAQGRVKPADFFTRYHVLCQYDVFNYHHLASFYLNLDRPLRTGQRRRRRSLFIYEDF